MKTLNLQPTLQGPTLTLRPLTADDLEGLYAAASDPLVWAQHPDPLRHQRAVFETRFFYPGLQAGSALAVIDQASGHIIGSSRFYDVDATKRELAIGYTFLARPYWGGATNRELKSLMLDHAFEWAQRVWFHIGVDNLRSRKAIEKIGAQLSHVMDREINGGIYPTAFYSLARG
jgi:RimJ/RimL family protein N-acetyltransferase